MKRPLKKINSSAKTTAMLVLHEKFIRNKKGHKKAVILDLKEYKKLLARLEDVYDLQLIEKRKGGAVVSTQEFKSLLTENGLL